MWENIRKKKNIQKGIDIIEKIWNVLRYTKNQKYMYSKDILKCDRTPEKQNSTGIRKTF